MGGAAAAVLGAAVPAAVFGAAVPAAALGAAAFGAAAAAGLAAAAFVEKEGEEEDPTQGVKEGISVLHVDATGRGSTDAITRCCVLHDAHQRKKANEQCDRGILWL